MRVPIELQWGLLKIRETLKRLKESRESKRQKRSRGGSGAVRKPS